MERKYKVESFSDIFLPRRVDRPFYKKLYYKALGGFNYLKYAVQDWYCYEILGRIKYGFPPQQAWDFCSEHAKWSLPRIKLLRKSCESEYPRFDSDAQENQLEFEFVGRNEDEYRAEKWRQILDKIIWSFENVDKLPDLAKPLDYNYGYEVIENSEDGSKTVKSLDDRPLDFTPLEKHRERVQEGLDLFSKYYLQLWR